MSENISKLSGRKGLKNNLFKRLTDIGQQRRIATQTELKTISEEYNLRPSTLYGASTFYEFLTESHLDKKAYVCNGSACLCAGTQPEVRQQLENNFGAENVGSICCLGRCYEGSAFQIEGRNYSGNAITALDENQKNQNHLKTIDYDDGGYHVEQYGARNILTDDYYNSLEACTKSLQAMLVQSKIDTLESIKKSGLRGRGGAGFPTAIKWQSCLDIESDQKYVVCNADEGDPGAFSDRYLLEQQPQRVILGMIVCAYLTGATEGVLYIRGEYPESIEIINRVLEEFREYNLLGVNILSDNKGTDDQSGNQFSDNDKDNFNFDLMVIEGAGAYICGEETALLASIEGRRGEVDVRPPFPTEQGLFKKPTVVNNVETFAAIPTILEMGGKQYSLLGTEKSTGTKLVSLDVGFNRPGIYEVELGTPLTTIVDKLGQGFKQPIKALHIGGPLGGLVPIHKMNDLNLDFECFSEHDFLLGHASVVCIPESMPIIDYLEHLFEFTAAESCGKCFPCRLGSVRGKEMMSQAKAGEQKLDHGLLTDLLDTLERGSLCALGGGLPLPIKNALMYFDEELSPYFSKQIEVRNLI